MNSADYKKFNSEFALGKKMNVEIKLATKHNLIELLPLVHAYHKFEEIELTDNECKNSIQQILTNKSLGGIWLVCVDNQVVGYIALCLGFSIEFSGLDAFVDEFYIIPEFRSKGIGTKVLEFIKEEAVKMNVGALHLEVARSNKKAKNLYNKANFKARERYVLMSVNLKENQA